MNNRCIVPNKTQRVLYSQLNHFLTTLRALSVSKRGAWGSRTESRCFVFYWTDYEHSHTKRGKNNHAVKALL